MKSKNHIVRTRTIHNVNKEHGPPYYEINLMTFEKFAARSNQIIIGISFEHFPYKWYNINYMWELPSFWFLTKYFNKRPQEITPQKIKIASNITLILEVLTFAISVYEVFIISN